VPRVRVVLPTFNRAAEVVAAVETALAQTFQDYEVVVVDDGSADDTLARLQPRAARDRRVRVHAAPHRGVAAARNTAVNLPGDYEYVAFLDADDRWEADHLERSVALMDSEPDVSLVSGVFVTEDLTGSWTAEEFQARNEKIRRMVTLATRRSGPDGYVLDPQRTFSAFVRSEVFPYTSTVVVRAARVRSARWYDPELVVSSDSDFYLRLGSTGEPWAFIDRLQCTVRFLGDNLTRSQDLSSPRTLAKQRSVLTYCRRRLALCTTESDRRHVRREVAGQAYLIGQCCDVQGDRRGARAAYWQSLRLAANGAAARGLAANLLPQRTANGLKALLPKA
jgi:glycosyltransferase involved in cell wall biosynthesis